MRIAYTLMGLSLAALGLATPSALQAYATSPPAPPAAPPQEAPSEPPPAPPAPAAPAAGPQDAAGQTQETPAAPVRRNVLVHLTKDTGDLHAVSMALRIARAMAQRGASVTLYLDLEAVRLVDKRAPGDLTWGAGDETLDDLLDGFSQAGGTVVVCAHCADAVGLTATHLRNGAKIMTSGQIADVMLAVDLVVDY